MRFVILFSLTAILATAAAYYGNFSRSCTAVSLYHKFFLGATCCYPGDGGTDDQARNRLDLSMCIGLNQSSGHMQWEVYGKFSNYCNNCTVLEAVGEANHLLTCFCTPLVGNRGPFRSTLNLDEGISNDMGTLKCAGGMASVTHGNAQ